MADASHRVQPAPQLVLDYGFSVFNLALAGFLLWLRPCDRTARLLVVGMVGTSAVFNLQAHGVYETLRRDAGRDVPQLRAAPDRRGRVHLRAAVVPGG